MQHSCDPLAPRSSSVQFDASQVIAAGRDEDGTLYVAYGENRLFVGREPHLLERYVRGSGQSGSQLDLSYSDDDGTSVTVEVVRGADGTQMTVAHGEQDGKGIDAGNGEPLTLLDAASVAKMSATTTQVFAFEFAASLDDGRELVVMAPAHGVDYSEYRVFLGSTSELAELKVTNFGSTQGGRRFAEVLIDGAAADLTYLAGGPSAINPEGAPSTLTIGDVAHSLSEGPAPAGASYACFSD